MSASQGQDPDRHIFLRPQAVSPDPAVGHPWSPAHTRYDQGVRYLYRHGAHQLTLFWPAPTPDEVHGLSRAAIEVGLFTHGPAGFLLYKIQGVCEWSDAAFNLALLPPDERELPAEATGERARLKLALVNCDDGLVVARRLVSLEPVMTQALRHVMQAQADTPFNRQSYDLAVAEVHRRYTDSDALVKVAEVVEACLG